LRELIIRNNLKFSFQDGYDEQQLISELTDHYPIKKERSMFKSFAIYDTSGVLIFVLTFKPNLFIF